MRRLAVGLVLASALSSAATASAAQTLDAGDPQAGPVLVTGGVAWADATALRVSAGGNPARPLVTLAPASNDGFYANGARFSDLSAADGQLGYSVAHYDTAASKSGGSSLVLSQAFTVPVAGGSPVSVLSCNAGSGTTAVAVGLGFTVVRGCLPEPTSGSTFTGPNVTIAGAVVGQGTAVAAAGAYAAWSPGSTVTVAQARPTTTVLGTVPVSGAWALAPDGSVVTVGASVGTTQLASTPPGGASTPIGDEPGGVFGLTAGAGGTIAFATQGEARSQTIVVRRGAERVEVARLWPDTTGGGPVATDGTRVAWFSARCGGTDLTVATIGEPPIDQRGTACPVTIAARGGLQRTVVTPQLTCDTRVAPQACQARVRIRARGRLIATGSVTLGQSSGGPVRLTSAGRRMARGHGRLRAQVEAVRSVSSGAPLTTRRSVLFVR